MLLTSGGSRPSDRGGRGVGYPDSKIRGSLGLVQKYGGGGGGAGPSGPSPGSATGNHDYRYTV